MQSRFQTLPREISQISILQFIPPNDLDAYYLGNPQLENWCRKPENLEFYLRLTKNEKYLSNVNEGLAWAAGNGSKMLINYFLFKGAKNCNQAMAYAAERGHQEIVNQMLA